MKKYWKFNLHLCQEQLRNVRVSQFSSSFSWDDWFCESYTSYTTINYTCFYSWKHSPQLSILWFCNIRVVKKLISIFHMYIPCEVSSWTLFHQNRKLSSRISLQNCSACADYQPWLSTPRLSVIWTHNISGDKHWLHR